MHCVRRAALRAACSSSRFVAAPRQQVISVAMQMNKVNAQSTISAFPPRHFSQTSAVFEDETDAVENAIRAAEGNASTLESSQTENQRITSQGHTIFISNVTFDATEAHLDEAFGKYGEILRSNIGRDARGLSRGFGFVTFGTREAADRAVNEANQSFWHGRRIVVDHRKEDSSRNPRGGREGKLEPTNSLYIGNIPYESSDADLNKMFRALDKVTDIRVAIDRNTGWPRGFAHADFEDVESAMKAHEFLSTQSLSGRTLRVDYAQNRDNFRRGGSKSSSSSGSF